MSTAGRNFLGRGLKVNRHGAILGMQMHGNTARADPFGPSLETALSRLLGMRSFISGANSDPHGEEPHSLCGVSNHVAPLSGE